MAVRKLFPKTISNKYLLVRFIINVTGVGEYHYHNLLEPVLYARKSWFMEPISRDGVYLLLTIVNMY